MSDTQTKRVLRVVGGKWEVEDDEEDRGGSEGGGEGSMIIMV